MTYSAINSRARNSCPAAASLRLLEEREQKIEGLRKSLLDGERSGDVGELDMKKIKANARQQAKSRA
jgi:hypothetical protein